MDDDDLDDSDREFWDELIEEGLIPGAPALRVLPSMSAADADAHVTVVSSTSSPQPCSDSLLCQEPAEPQTDTTTDSTSDLASHAEVRSPDLTSNTTRVRDICSFWHHGSTLWFNFV